LKSHPSDRPEPLPSDIAEALERVRHRLGRIGARMLYFSRVGSTNTVAVALAESVDSEGAVVIAGEQTAGRGRRGRRWFSPPASGLYVSIVLSPFLERVDPERATLLLPLAAGVALADAVEAATGLGIELKWPNDLYVARRKLGGILAETNPSGGGAPREPMNVIVGYGINVRAAVYPPEVGDRATSLESELGRSVDRAQLLAETLAAVSRRYDDLLAGRYDVILDAWRARAPGIAGARVSWTTTAGVQSGVTTGIDDRGALLVRAGDRVERIVAGELTWR
jgi:BirA family transcriptional regulator, biotin operon repressor / biotin---[acetyl-CoA-carboxylase] ligase